MTLDLMVEKMDGFKEVLKDVRSKMPGEDTGVYLFASHLAKSLPDEATPSEVANCTRNAVYEVYTGTEIMTGMPIAGLSVSPNFDYEQVKQKGVSLLSLMHFKDYPSDYVCRAQDAYFGLI